MHPYFLYKQSLWLYKFGEGQAGASGLARQRERTCRTSRIKCSRAYLFRYALLLCTPAGGRTLDTLIKSQVLYQLSYKRVLIVFASAKVVVLVRFSKLFGIFFQRGNAKVLERACLKELERL